MDANESVARAWLEAWNNGKPKVLDTVCAKDYIEYDPAFPEGQADRDGVKRAIAMYRTAFPDLQFTLQDSIVATDKVAVYWKVSGTNLGEFRGEPPTGKHAEGEGITIMLMRDGKAVEARSCWDVTSFRQQAGTLRTPAETAVRN